MEEKNEIQNEIKIEDQKENPTLKVLLMGMEGVGKTSIKSIIFNNMEPQETFNLASTEEIEINHIQYINNTFIDVLDFSSNKKAIKEYFSTKKEFIFSNVGILIYISDAQDQKDDDIKFFEQ